MYSSLNRCLIKLRQKIKFQKLLKMSYFSIWIVFIGKRSNLYLGFGRNFFLCWNVRNFLIFIFDGKIWTTECVFLNLNSYALEMYYKMTQSELPGFYIGSKYYILQLYFVVTRFHVLIFDALGNNEYLPCQPPISAFVSGLCEQFYLKIFLLYSHIFSIEISINYLLLQVKT